MAIWYVDYVNGNNANDGKTWATAFKLIDGVTSAKGFVSGDFVRIAKSPDPTSLGQTAQWTDNSKVVTLSSPVTANLDLCEIAWTKAAASTSTTSTGSPRQGSANLSITNTGALSANVLVAYNAINPGDLSAYQQISFWYQSTNTSPTNVWRICLCSDNAGQTIVFSAALPQIFASNVWTPITIDLGVPLTGSIQSIALYSGSAPQGTTATMQLDNIVACKPSSAPDALTLLSLLGKNNGTDPWGAIQSINGTTITLDNQVSVTQANTRPYAGVTESVTAYKRETTKTVIVSSSGTSVQAPAIPSNSQVTYSGGWNTASGVQDGETFYDGQCGNGQGLNINNFSVMAFENISAVRYYYAYWVFQALAGSTIKAYQISNNSNNAINCGGGSYPVVVNATIANVCYNSTGIVNAINATFTIGNLNSNSTAVSLFPAGNIFNVSICRSNQYAFSISSAGWWTLIKNVQFGNNTYDINLATANGSPYIYLKNVLGGTVQCQSGTESRVTSQNDQRVAGATKITAYDLYIVNDTTVVHTAGGMSWKMSPLASRNNNYPAWLNLAKIFCPANQQRTFTAWVRRDKTNVVGLLMVRGGRVEGITNNVLGNLTAAAINTWEQLSVTVTPTEDAVIEVEAWAYYPSTYVASNLWVTEFSAI